MVAPAKPDRVGGLDVFRPQVNLLAIACFIAGLGQTIRFNLVGEATLAEFLLPVVGVGALLHREGRRFLSLKVFRWLLFAMLITLGGYVLSDVVRDTPEAQYLRGWGRMALVITAYVSLCAVIARQRQNLWWFVAGMALGRLVYLRIVLNSPISLWKFSYEGFGYGEPLTLAVAVGACFLGARVASALFVVLAIFSIHYDFRSQGAVCMVLAGILQVRAARPERPLKPGGSQIKLAVLAMVVVAAIYGGLKLSEDGYAAERRGASDIGRAVGKVFAMKAISESPIIGYGSWSKSHEFHRMHAEALKEVAGKEASRFKVGDSSSSTHSMILQAWVEGGLFAIAFFICLGVLLMRTVPWLMLHRPLDGLTPVVLYFCIYGLWHIAMSAFASPLRIHLAMAAAGVVFMALEKPQHRRAPASARVMTTPATGL